MLTWQNWAVKKILQSRAFSSYNFQRTCSNCTDGCCYIYLILVYRIHLWEGNHNSVRDTSPAWCTRWCHGWQRFLDSRFTVFKKCHSEYTPFLEENVQIWPVSPVHKLPRTMEKSSLVPPCLEDMWTAKLRNKGWSHYPTSSTTIVVNTNNGAEA